MDPTHTLDFTRLRVLENIKINLLGSMRAIAVAVEEIEKKRISLVKRLERARELAKGTRNSAPVSEIPYHGYNNASIDYAGLARVIDNDQDLQSNWAKEAIKLEEQLKALEAEQKSLKAQREDASERFNEAAGLYDACQAFVDNILHGNSGEMER